MRMTGIRQEPLCPSLHPWHQSIGRGKLHLRPDNDKERPSDHPSTENHSSQQERQGKERKTSFPEPRYIEADVGVGWELGGGGGL